jgi:hypothetical protein
VFCENKTTGQQQAATTMTIAGAWIGCMLAPKPNEKYGRRLTLLYNNLLFIIGEILLVAKRNVSLLVVSSTSSSFPSRDASCQVACCASS